MPARRPHPFLDHDGPLPIVHRGGAGDADENTLEAFELAVAMGYRCVETDLRATADGVLVAFHDARLGRVTDRDGRIDELPWSEVGQARVAGRSPLPRLDELLASFPDVRFNLDAKHPAVLRPLAALLTAQPALLDRVCLASFSDARLGWLRTALGPRLCTGLGPREIARVKLASATGRRPPRLPPTALAAQVPHGPRALPLVDRRFVETAHAGGLAVHLWTIDDAAEMAQLLDLGVDGIMTDRPRVLLDVLARRAGVGGAGGAGLDHGPPP